MLSTSPRSTTNRLHLRTLYILLDTVLFKDKPLEVNNNTIGRDIIIYYLSSSLFILFSFFLPTCFHNIIVVVFFTQTCSGDNTLHLRTLYILFETVLFKDKPL
jgi:hypothetical protein